MYKPYYVLVVCLLALFCVPREGDAQSSYELLPAPDVWYNSVDGVRVGIRLRGQQAGSFGSGAHRLNIGLWLGTKFPESPVSYYFSFTEPINSISEFGSEGNINVQSLYRTGFQNHGISFNKRWQTGFNEMNYKELSVGFRVEDRFDNDYLLYQKLWQDDRLYLASLQFRWADENAPGRYLLSFSADANLGGGHGEFFRSTISYQQKMELSRYFTLFGRVFTGIASNQTAPEYLFLRSIQSPRIWMERGLTRARGTMPPAWVESGTIQITGGPGLRGYVGEDIKSLNSGDLPLLTSMSAVNFELDYPNPLDKAVNAIPVVGGLMDLRSYLFFDSGTSVGITTLEESRTLSDAGLGFLFSIDIPDYLGKSRGIQLRYDIPLWVSHPGNDNSFEFRNVVAIGAVISI